MNNDADQKAKWEVRRDELAETQGYVHAVPIVRSMYPSKSRGQMATKFAELFSEGYDTARADALAEIESLRAENAELKEQFYPAKKYLKIEPVINQMGGWANFETWIMEHGKNYFETCEAIQTKLSAATARMENLAAALEQYSAGDLTPVATEALKKYRESKI